MVDLTTRATRAPRPSRAPRARRAAQPGRGVAALVVAGALLLAVALPALVVRRPLVAAIAVTAAIVGPLVLLRLDWAVLLFVALSPFEDYAAGISGASVKLAGLAVFAAWGLRLLVDRTRGRLRHPAVAAAFALALVVLAAAVVHDNGPEGTTVVIRYLSFIGAFVVLVDVMRGLVPPRRVAAVYVLSCAAAAACGLYESFVLGEYRAAGPIGDANDFAFFLVAAFPLALALRAGKRRGLWTACALLSLAGIAGSLSRGAVLAVVVMACWSFLAGDLRTRTAVATLAVVVIGLGTVIAAAPALVAEKLAAKEKVADTNVVERKVRWLAAAEMTVDQPVLGLGPGGFKANYARYVGQADPNPTHQLEVAHTMYLEVSAELGVTGLAVFSLVLYAGFHAAGQARLRATGVDRHLAGASRAALVGLAVAAVFLTEQYFLPIWLVPAIGVALDLRHRAAA